MPFHNNTLILSCAQGFRCLLYTSILTEAGTDLESGQLEWLVVGIGLNLTSTAADWPEELARRAGSLYPGGPAPVSRAALDVYKRQISTATTTA